MIEDVIEDVIEDMIEDVIEDVIEEVIEMYAYKLHSLLPDVVWALLWNSSI